MRSLRCRWLTREPPPRHPFLTPGGIIIANTWSFLMERAGIEMVITSFENTNIFQKFWSNANYKERLFILWKFVLKTTVEYTLLWCNMIYFIYFCGTTFICVAQCSNLHLLKIYLREDDQRAQEAGRRRRERRPSGENRRPSWLAASSASMHSDTEKKRPTKENATRNRSPDRKIEPLLTENIQIQIMIIQIAKWFYSNGNDKY